LSAELVSERGVDLLAFKVQLAALDAFIDREPACICKGVERDGYPDHPEHLQRDNILFRSGATPIRAGRFATQRNSGSEEPM
jgi:hypothetical protein